MGPTLGQKRPPFENERETEQGFCMFVSRALNYCALIGPPIIRGHVASIFLKLNQVHLIENF